MGGLQVTVHSLSWRATANKVQQAGVYNALHRFTLAAVFMQFLS